MKLKATYAGLPQGVVDQFNRIRPLALKSVLIPHLKVLDTISPAGFFVQKSDVADDSTHQPFVHVGLSGVSLNNERAANDFLKACSALTELYQGILQGCIDLKGKTVTLFVVLYLDGKHPSTGSSLVESGEIQIEIKGDGLL